MSDETRGLDPEALDAALLAFDGISDSIPPAKARRRRHVSAAIVAYLSHRAAEPSREPDLALIEATARKLNPGRSEDHIKSVALDALSIYRALKSSELT